MRGLFLLLAGWSLAAGLQARAEEEWKQATQSENLTIWQRDVPGEKVKEIKASGRIDAPPAAVFAVIRDIAHYADIMPYTTKETKVLETSADGKTVYYYTVVDAPIVSKRDHTLKVTVEKSGGDDGVYRLSWATANEHPKAPPVRDGYVRLTNTKGSWDLKPMGDGQSTFVTYYVYTDPGGSLPKFVINKANTEAVPKVFEALRTFSKKAPYNTAK